MGGARRSGNNNLGGGAAQPIGRKGEGSGNRTSKQLEQQLAQQQEQFKENRDAPTPPKADGTMTEKSHRTCLHTQLRKTKICMYHLRGACQYNDECAFAHSCSELSDTPDLSKTRLCKAYLNDGKCDDKDCTFAHGEEELRSTNMFFKKTLCMWNEKGKCRNGDQCRFAHGNVELRDGCVKPAEQSKGISSAPPANPGSGRVKGRRSHPQAQKGQPQPQQQEQEHLDQKQQQFLLQQHMMQMQLLQQQLLQQQQLLPNYFGDWTMLQHAGPEPMKIPIAGMGWMPHEAHVRGSYEDAFKGDYDEALKGQLDSLRQKISVLSLRCQHIQKQMGPMDTSHGYTVSHQSRCA